MNWGLVRSIIILPGNALVFIPAIILWVADDTEFAAHLAGPGQTRFWLALVFAGFGLFLAVWTVRLFLKLGGGTPAPWDPPRKLVVRGPYRHVRNPMITSVLIVILAQALLFQSWPIVGWMAFFFLANIIYFPLREEKELERRFGDDYRAYKANVPRWIPRIRPWTLRQ